MTIAIGSPGTPAASPPGTLPASGHVGRAWTLNASSRDVDAALAARHPDVDWPDAIDGGRVRGNDAATRMDIEGMER
jgi:hypothetical protein